MNISNNKPDRTEWKISPIGAMLLLALICGLVCVACSRPPAKPEGGLALSFDDRASINSWAEAIPFFREHGIRATFFVDRIDALTPEQQDTLKQLAADGHEIGSHGFRHKDAADLLARGLTAEDYLDVEIRPSLEHMERLGFSCRSFAYPYGSHTEETDRALTNYFVMIRKVRSEDYYYSGAGGPFVGALYIDGNRLNEARLERILQRVRDTGEVVSLSGHKIGPVGGDSWCSFQTLEIIARLARKYDLKFYTMTELAELH